MNKIRSVFFLFFLIVTPLKAKEVISLSAMTYFQTQSLYRGAQIWEDPNMIIGASAIFWQKLEWRGPHLDYHFFERSDNIALDLGLSFFSDSGPQIKLTSREKDYRNQRGDSLDFMVKFKYKFGWRNFFAVGLEVYQDIIEHKGIYIKPLFELPVLPFTKLALSMGYGNLSANQYAYGPDAINGAGNFEATLKNVVVNLPWKSIILNQFGSSWIVSHENKVADYIRGNAQNYFFNTRFIWTFY